MMHEFSEMLLNQLNLLREARTMERFRRSSTAMISSISPGVIRITSKRRLTMEFIDGIKVSDVEAIEKAGLDRKQSPRTGPKSC